MPAPTKLTAAAVKREVSGLRDPVRARFLQCFFRTAPGEYAEGDRMLGLRVPDERRIARAFRTMLLGELGKLLRSPFHEHRLIALLILVDQHNRGDREQRRKLHEFYIGHIDRVNNWDLVDTSAGTLGGEHIENNPALLQRLIQSSSLWHRRIAMLSTFFALRSGRPEVTFSVAAQLLADKQDLIHKAVGWLLRETGKNFERELLQFLRNNYAQLPRTTLRYAIERLPPAERKLWLAGPR